MGWAGGEWSRSRPLLRPDPALSPPTLYVQGLPLRLGCGERTGADKASLAGLPGAPASCPLQWELSCCACSGQPSCSAQRLRAKAERCWRSSWIGHLAALGCYLGRLRPASVGPLSPEIPLAVISQPSKPMCPKAQLSFPWSSQAGSWHPQSSAVLTTHHSLEGLVGHHSLVVGSPQCMGLVP